MRSSMGARNIRIYAALFTAVIHIARGRRRRTPQPRCCSRSCRSARRERCQRCAIHSPCAVLAFVFLVACVDHVNTPRRHHSWAVSCPRHAIDVTRGGRLERQPKMRSLTKSCATRSAATAACSTSSSCTSSRRRRWVPSTAAASGSCCCSRWRSGCCRLADGAGASSSRRSGAILLFTRPTSCSAASRNRPQLRACLEVSSPRRSAAASSRSTA